MIGELFRYNLNKLCSLESKERYSLSKNNKRLVYGELRSGFNNRKIIKIIKDNILMSLFSLNNR